MCIYLCVVTCVYLPVCSNLCGFTYVLSDDYGESRMVRTRSLSKISSSVARQQYVDTSDEDEYPKYPPMYQQPAHRRRNSRASSQENLGQAPPVRENNQSLSVFELYNTNYWFITWLLTGHSAVKTGICCHVKTTQF